ncbi:MAG: hypothetical protein OEY94_00860 [Alphaproteobacteria bacterium]|nr:hypothetical protein [Alphaproteobacteria bacterium]
MSDYLDLVYLLNGYNLIGNPQGVLTVPNLDVPQDDDDNHIVTYSFFRTADDIIFLHIGATLSYKTIS